MSKTNITWEQIYHRLNEVMKDLPKDTKYYGVPRGGQIVAGITGNAVNTIKEADVIIDDLIDGGGTLERYKKHNKPFVALIDKRIELQGKWIVFPWEIKEEPVADNIIRICQYYGLKEVNNLEQLIYEYEKR